MLKVLLLSSALALTAASAEAATVFTDNFNSDTPSLNSTGDAFFLSTSPSYNKPNEASIDIIGSGPSGTSFDILPGNGYYVDLDGSSGYGNKPLAGQLTYKGTFAPGNYVLTFDLAGNQRGAGAQTTEVGGNLLDNLRSDTELARLYHGNHRFHGNSDQQHSSVRRNRPAADVRV
jgi:hypothetical protein